MRVLITGADGQLGRELRRALANHTVLATDIRESDSVARMDICDYQDTVAVVTEFGPDVAIHAAALTNVDRCEREPELAYSVNGLGSQNVALACRRVGAAMVYVSTDYVFDGEKGEPYREWDPVGPVSVYGRSKLAGEQSVQSLLRSHYIVRTAWLYSEHGSNFVKWALRAGQEQSELLGVTDQVGSPTSATDLAAAIGQLIASERYGIYHLTNAGGCSRYELLCRILELAGRPRPVRPLTTEQFLGLYPMPARRPASSMLLNFCADRSLGIRLRPWDEALKELVCLLQS